MSIAYTIQHEQACSEVRVVKDGCETQIDLPPIVSDIGDRLIKKLGDAGWEIKDGAATKNIDGVNIKVTPDGKVSVTCEQEETLSVTVVGVGRGDRDFDAQGGQKKTEEAAKEDAAVKAKSALNAAEEAARQRLTEKVTAALQEVRKELDERSLEVLEQALKDRATQLGQVIESSGNAQDGTLTIKVKL